jgi:hypothetical protein
MKLKHIISENKSINEADVVGKTIFSDGKGKLHFGYYKTDDAVEFVDYKTWKKLSFKDVSKGDTNKDRVIKAILKGQKQFNKSVEYNMWSKKNNPSFEQKMDWFIQNGWISNINKGGIKESVESVNEVDEIDTVTMDIPLFIRTLEYAREDAKTDMDLHDFAENAISLSKELGKLTMDSYDKLIGDKSVNEAKTIIVKFNDNDQTLNFSDGEKARVDYDGEFKYKGKWFDTTDMKSSKDLEKMLAKAFPGTKFIQKESAIKLTDLVNEANVETYHKSFTHAAEAAKAYALKKGYDINEDDWQSQVAMGGRYSRSRPGVGKTHSFSVGLLRNGKPQRKNLNFSVYGMESGNFELTAYVN